MAGMECAGLLIGALDMTFKLSSAIYAYTKSVRSAREDIDRLSSELFTLSGLFTRIQSLPPTPAISSEAFYTVLKDTTGFLSDLQRSLEEKGKRVRLKWPLKEDETQKHLQRLERVKSYFLLCVMTDGVELVQGVAGEVANMRKEMEGLKRAVTDIEFDDTEKAIRSWLCDIEPSVTMEKVLGRRVGSSGDWLLNSEAYRRWLMTLGSTFWLEGITGAGKTMLMSIVTQSLLDSTAGPRTAVAYFYCSFDDIHSQDAAVVLGSMLSQLCPRGDPFLLQEVKKLYDMRKAKQTAGKPSGAGPEELVALLATKLMGQGRTFLVIDGLNECSEPWAVLSHIHQLCARAPRINIFLSCISDHGQLHQIIQGLPSLTTVSLRANDIASDISLLIDSYLNSHSRLRGHPPDVKRQIATTLAEGSQGMFRWAYCQLERLGKLRTRGAIMDALRNLPKNLDKTYEELLLRIDGEEDKYLAREILEFVSVSLAPVTLSCIVESLQVVPDADELDDTKALADPRDILNICGSLLTYDPETETVSLAHHSIKTYLASDLPSSVSYFRVTPESGHANVAIKCLTSLSSSICSSGPVSRSFLIHRLDNHPFLSYASHNWPHHVRQLPTISADLWKPIRSFLFSTGHFLAWVQMLIPGGHPQHIASTPPLYYAASFGLATVVEFLLDAGAPTDVHGGRFMSSPIAIAAYRGHADVVRALLKGGANPRFKDAYEDMDAIKWARLQGHDEIIKLIEEWEEMMRDEGYGDELMRVIR